MGKLIFFFTISLVMLQLKSASSKSILTIGSSLSVENPDDVLVSPKTMFTAGFYPVGKNSCSFAIWYTKPLYDGSLTLVWMANRDQPVNGKYSKLSLRKNGNLILTDADQFDIWATKTSSNSSVELFLYDTGNLVLLNSRTGLILWQSFDFPTDTLLANQPLTRYTTLYSSRSSTNFSEGFYKLLFDDDNLLHLIYNGLEVTSGYWPDPWLNSWQAGRTSYNDTRLAVFDLSGHFISSDDFEFRASDYRIGVQRRLKVDIDGNFRMYSLDEKRQTWSVTWQAFQEPCKIHGTCGPNSICTYTPQEGSGRKCSCVPGYKMKNLTDWSFGCEPEFSLTCASDELDFLYYPNVEFYGYDFYFLPNYTLDMCMKECLSICKCYGIQFKYDWGNGYYNCYPKLALLNGYRSPAFTEPMYIKLPVGTISSMKRLSIKELDLDCPSQVYNLEEVRSYSKSKQNATLQFMVYFASATAGIEILCILIVCLFLYRTQRKTHPDNVYYQVDSGFRKFTYEELKKATNFFTEEIGRGGGGVVFKGVLSDYRVAAIKRLNEANQGEAEFLAEVSTIGKLNHMNLIEMWGYCAEGKHRLLVYEYLEHGSLAKNLDSNTIDSEKRFDIAVGTAKGLAYLHEECLEWVLHCDVKPQNVLLDSSFQPKVADFGLSKLLNRTGENLSDFSRIRGTRGYMAPEWISNLAITSKVDVYSYGIVVLEMVTGKSPLSGNGLELAERGLVSWVREIMNRNPEDELLIKDIIDTRIKDDYDDAKMKALVEVALQCVDDDKDARPTMRKVTEMLLHHKSDCQSYP